jgi:dipeptidyl aminopeptidase/acylaminoacyl peptidase
VYHVTPDDAPALLIHGDADQLVPLQQSERIVAAYRDQKVPVELFIKPGQAHGWPKLHDDLVHFADWFDRHLSESAPSK